MKKLFIVALCLLSASILTAGNTQSGAPIAQDGAPILTDEQLLENLRIAIQANNPDQVTDVLIKMESQRRIKRLINRYIFTFTDHEIFETTPCSALHLAAYYGYEIIVNLLLDWGANPNGINPDPDDPFISKHTDIEFTPLQLAALFGHSLIVQQLLQRNASPNLRTRFYDPPLFCAIKGNCSEETIKMLLAKGAKLKWILGATSTGTPLHCAIESDNEVAMQILLSLSFPRPIDKSKFINRRNSEGQTALHCAAKSGNCAAISMLLDNGAHIHVRTFFDKLTPLMYAQAGGHDGAVNLLIQRGATH